MRYDPRTAKSVQVHFFVCVSNGGKEESKGVGVESGDFWPNFDFQVLVKSLLNGHVSLINLNISSYRSEKS